MEIESENQLSLWFLTKPENPRQSLPSTPKKWGFKIFVQAGVSGFMYDSMVYTRKSLFDSLESLGAKCCSAAVPNHQKALRLRCLL